MSLGRMRLSKVELKRAMVLDRVLRECMSGTEAAASLGVSVRQLRRIKAKYVEGGAEGLVHGNFGRKPKHTLSEDMRVDVLRLFEEKYYGCDFCHFAELLGEHEGIKISPSSVERILKAGGREAKRPQKRRSGKRRPRNRRTQAGMLRQIDSAPYERLGAGFGKFALHAVIDDATGIVAGAHFTLNECFEGYSEVMRQGLGRYGIPLGIYGGKHTVFRSPKEKPTIDEQLAGQENRLSDFGKAMKELNTGHIKANTPQAKGRIERLWETLQDRLPAEFRLRGVKSIGGANAALPKLTEKHNKLFSVIPLDSAVAYMPLPKDTRLSHVFARHVTRRAGAGGEITYKNNVYVPSDAEYDLQTRTAAEVRETFAGEVIVWHEKQAIPLKKIERPIRRSESGYAKPPARPPYKPAADHPWRKSRTQKEQKALPSPTVV